MINVFPKDKLVRSKVGYTVHASMSNPVSFQVDGDLATDEITISYSGLVDAELTDAYDEDGDLLKLTQTNPQIVFYANAKIQIDKPAGTANDIGLNLV